ncbi:MAG: PSP1 C-terminal domain-containing protein [Gemmataceae bacterium]
MEHCEYLISYGKSGGFGRFRSEAMDTFQRGQRVVICTNRGPELGIVLCEAKASHQRILKDTSVGQLLRAATTADKEQQIASASLAQTMFDTARELARNSNLPIEILDIDIVLDGSQATLHSLMWAESDLSDFTKELQDRFEIVISFEDLGTPVPTEEDEGHGGCGQPGCGHSSGGGCNSCSSGGCSSCGSGGVDMKNYFAHLRGQMEDHYKQSGRTPLL